MVVVEGQVDALTVQAHLTQLWRDQHHVHEKRSSQPIVLDLNQFCHVRDAHEADTRTME